MTSLMHIVAKKLREQTLMTSHNFLSRTLHQRDIMAARSLHNDKVVQLYKYNFGNLEMFFLLHFLPKLNLIFFEAMAQQMFCLTS